MSQAVEASQRVKVVTYVGPQAALGSYCKQVITPELNELVKALVEKLRMFRERAMAKNPIKVNKPRAGRFGLVLGVLQHVTSRSGMLRQEAVCPHEEGCLMLLHCLHACAFLDVCPAVAVCGCCMAVSHVQTGRMVR
jgi:hypothetical protein